MDVITTNAFCMAIIGVLLFSSFIQGERDSKRSSFFSMLLVNMMLFMLFNIASEFLEGKTNFVFLNGVVNAVDFIFVDVIIYSFCRYFSALLRHANKGKSVRTHFLFLAKVLCGVRAVLITVLSATKQLFYIDENGFYAEGPASGVPYIFSGVIMFLVMVEVLLQQRFFPKRQVAVIMTYIILPIPLLFVELFTELYQLTPMALTLSILLVYVLIQASAITRGKYRESVLQEISSTDLLTGLNNRRAYDRYLSELPANESIGVLFCDINGLKYENDHFGHAAGDELIKTFAHLLEEVFPSENAFRISGDEFTVILPVASEKEFSDLADTLRIKVAQNRRLAAVGNAFGTGRCVEKLISEAESLMYEEKAKHHQNRA